MVNWWRAQNSEACRQNKSNSLNISELQAEREGFESKLPPLITI